MLMKTRVTAFLSFSQMALIQGEDSIVNEAVLLPYPPTFKINTNSHE